MIHVLFGVIIAVLAFSFSYLKISRGNWRRIDFRVVTFLTIPVLNLTSCILTALGISQFSFYLTILIIVLFISMLIFGVPGSSSYNRSIDEKEMKANESYLRS